MYQRKSKRHVLWRLVLSTSRVDSANTTTARANNGLASALGIHKFVYIL
jgi:hypothetical protein